MSDRYIGEIRMFAGDYAIHGFAFCDGSLVPIEEFTPYKQYAKLYAAIGTTYGGDGYKKFALPDLRGRLPIHQDTSRLDYNIGKKGGYEHITLTEKNLPKHRHSFKVSTEEATSSSPFKGVSKPLLASGPKLYYTEKPDKIMHEDAIGPSTIGVKSPKPLNNMMPSLAINFLIALTGNLSQPR